MICPRRARFPSATRRVRGSSNKDRRARALKATKATRLRSSRRTTTLLPSPGIRPQKRTQGVYRCCPELLVGTAVVAIPYHTGKEITPPLGQTSKLIFSTTGEQRKRRTNQFMQRPPRVSSSKKNVFVVWRNSGLAKVYV